jgi:hypothetical protein
MPSLISKFKALALYKKQGLHQEVADLLRSMTNDEVKELYRFLNEAYQESTEDSKYLILDDICYFSTIRVHMPHLPTRIVKASVSGITEWRLYHNGEVVGRFPTEEWAQKFFQLLTN